MQTNASRVPLLGLGTFQLKDPATLEYALRSAFEIGYCSIGTFFAHLHLPWNDCAHSAIEHVS